MKYSQKGAMFGLDARIALAIFGALSVITGAALYSAIQDANVTAVVTEMNEVDKALTSYYLDTGTYPDEAAAGAGLLEIQELTSSTATGWLGPYLTYADGATADMLDHAKYTEISMYRAIDGSWDDVTNTVTSPECLSGSADNCSVFVCITGIPDDVSKAIDTKVDGSSAAANTGNFRYATSRPACLKGMMYDKTLAPAA